MSSQYDPLELISQLDSSREFFNRSTRVLEESDSSFRPTPAVMTVAQQIGHAAQSIDWFMEGATRAEGFDLDFEKAAQEIEAITSLNSAREMLNHAYDKALGHLKTLTSDDLAKPLPPGPIMGGEPFANVLWALIDHSAHHRGALTVYTRLLGKVPVMPYAG